MSAKTLGPGFALLKGPEGPAAAEHPFPVVFKLTGGELDTETKQDQVALQTLHAGGVNGDMVLTPGGELFTLEIIGLKPYLVHLGSVVGPKGDDGPGAVVPAHTVKEHNIPDPVPFLPGDYAALAEGPKLELIASSINITPFP